MTWDLPALTAELERLTALVAVAGYHNVQPLTVNGRAANVFGLVTAWKDVASGGYLALSVELDYKGVHTAELRRLSGGGPMVGDTLSPVTETGFWIGCDVDAVLRCA